MEERKMCRERFWNSGAKVDEEIMSYVNVTEEGKDAEFSPFDEWVTLICC